MRLISEICISITVSIFFFACASQKVPVSTKDTVTIAHSPVGTENSKIFVSIKSYRPESVKKQEQVIEKAIRNEIFRTINTTDKFTTTNYMTHKASKLECCFGILSENLSNQFWRDDYTIVYEYSIVDESGFSSYLRLIDNESCQVLRQERLVSPSTKTNEIELAVRKATEQLLQYPAFPWPPPNASCSYAIPLKNIPPKTRNMSSLNKTVRRQSLSDIDKILSFALDACGFFEKRYYSVPGGFAIVTQLEKMNPDGTSKEGSKRWNLNFDSDGSYLSRLFKPKVGQYRSLAFLVSNISFNQKEVPLDERNIKTWMANGINKLPTLIGEFPYTDNHFCTALIFEFEKKDVDKNMNLLVPGKLSAYEHLTKTKLINEFLAQ